MIYPLATNTTYLRLKHLRKRQYGPPIRNWKEASLHILNFVFEVVFAIIWINWILRMLSWLI